MASETRDELNARAAALGIADPDKLQNMDAVRAAIVEAGGEPEVSESEEATLERFAKEWTESGFTKFEPGIKYRIVTSGGQSNAVAVRRK